jgi:hypothetical protein
MSPRRATPLLVRVALLVPGVVVAAACHRDAEPGSCHKERENLCVEFGSAEAAAGKRMCAGATWIPGDKSCPSASRIGVCTKKASSVEQLYGGAPNNYTRESARSACEFAGGTFAAAP